MKHKKRFRGFTDVLEWEYYLKYHMDTFQFIQLMLSDGIAYQDAFEIVQDQMNDLWKEYRNGFTNNSFESVEQGEYIPFAG